MPKKMDKKPKNRICPLLYFVKLRNDFRQISGNSIGINPSIINIRAKANRSILSNYFLLGLFKYLKKSEFASKTIISSLVLKLFLYASRLL